MEIYCRIAEAPDNYPASVVVTDLTRPCFRLGVEPLRLHAGHLCNIVAGVSKQLPFTRIEHVLKVNPLASDNKRQQRPPIASIDSKLLPFTQINRRWNWIVLGMGVPLTDITNQSIALPPPLHC